MFKTYVEPRTAGELCHCKDSLAPFGLGKPLLAGDQIPGAPLSFLQGSTPGETNKSSSVVFLLDYEQSLFFLGPSSKTRETRK